MSVVGVASVEIRPDVSKFGKDLSVAVEKSVKQVGDKAAALGVSLTKGLTAPIVGLGTAAVAAASSVEAALRDIRVGTGATGAALAELEADFRAVASTSSRGIGRVGTIVADLNTRLGVSGDAMRNLAGAVADLEQILGGVNVNLDTITRVFTAYGVTADNYEETLNRIFRASQATGVSFDNLTGAVVTQSAAFNELGFSLDEAVAIVGQFQKAGVNTETVISALRQNIVRAAKSGESAADFFRRGVREIEGFLKTGNEAAAQARASEIFGARTFLDALDAIRRGQFNIDELVGQIRNGNDTIRGLAQETRTLGDEFAEFRNRATLALEPLGRQIIPLLETALSTLIPIITRAAEIFSDLPVSVQQSIIGFGGLLAVIGPGLIVFASVARAIGTVVRMIGLLKTALLTTPWGLAAAGIGLVVGAFLAIKIRAEEAQQRIREMAGEIAELGPTGTARKRLETLIKNTEGLAGVMKAGGLRINDLSNAITGSAANFSKMEEQLITLAYESGWSAEQQARLSTALRVLRDDFGLATVKARELNFALGEDAFDSNEARRQQAIASTSTLSRGMDELSEDFMNAAAEAERMETIISSAFDTGVTSFLQFKDGSFKSANAFIDDLKRQTRELATFKANVARIGALTSQEFGAYLFSLGTDAAKVIDQLAKDPQKAIDAFEEWKRLQEAATDDLKASMTDYADHNEEEVARIIRQYGLLSEAARNLGMDARLRYAYSTTAYVPGMADGGIVTGPQLSLIGEAGSEAVIPLTRPQRAMELLEASGLAGMVRSTSQNFDIQVVSATPMRTAEDVVREFEALQYRMGMS